MIEWIKWEDDGKWVLFLIDDINHMSRNHALNLFAGKIPVIAKEGDTYISNDKKARHSYHKSGKKVMKFTDCVPSRQPLKFVGFFGELNP